MHIISQIITLLHVSTLSCHPQGALKSIPCQVTQVFQKQLLVIQFTINMFHIYNWNTCVPWQGIDYTIPEDDKSVETCGSVIICEIIVHLLVTVKVKCTILQALRLCTGCTPHRRCRGIALLFLDHGTKRGWGVSVTPRSLYTSGKDPVPFVQEAGWTTGPVWTGAENFALTGIRSPNLPARSQPPYRLRYPALLVTVQNIKRCTVHVLK